MNLSVRLALPLLALALAGCSSMNQTVAVSAPAPVAVAPVVATPVMTGPSPAQTTMASLQSTNVSSGFIDTSAVPLMTTADNSAANNAQFYALQFGRPGAPRSWTGDRGTTGSVKVGPFVRVNNLDCRDFEHTVKIGAQSYTRKGTACREQAGNWSVVANAA